MRKIKLVIIDPNNDFVSKDGALSVPEAETAASKIANFIDLKGHKFDIDTSLECRPF